MATSAAHGRVNLIGEHTDYNGGLVLPALIPLRTTVTVYPSADRVVTTTTDVPGLRTETFSLDDARPRGQWSDYVVGLAATLEARGHALRGFDASVTSDIPLGAGLASSAALLVATARGLREAFTLPLDDGDIADVAHAAEHSFVGARVGRMDQLVCSTGRLGDALFIDIRTGSTRAVPLSRLDVELAVIDSGIRHEHATGGYNARRDECERAAALLGVPMLRDVAGDADLAALPRELAARVRHVTSENARVVAAVAAIERDDASALGQILNAGHASLRDDYAVSLPAIDAIVAAAQADPDVYGARLTGGGFGGSVLVVAKAGAARAAAERVAAASSGHVLLPRQ